MADYECPNGTIRVKGREVGMSYYEHVKLCRECAEYLFRDKGEPKREERPNA